MIEIAAIVWLFLKLKRILEAKGRGMGLAFLAPVFWVLGEFLFAFAGGMVLTLLEVNTTILVYLFALIGAAAGGSLAYLIVKKSASAPLHCPACNALLPSDLNHNYSKPTCEHCGKGLSIWESKVTEQKTGPG